MWLLEALFWFFLAQNIVFEILDSSTLVSNKEQLYVLVDVEAGILIYFF
jgi:hypothetical protein